MSQLLAAARRGDDQARDQLFTACRSYLAIIARAQVGSWLQARVDASDLVQQTLLDAHRGLSDFRGGTEAEWLAWLRNILSNNAADFIRRHGASKRRIQKEVRLDQTDAFDASLELTEPVAASETPSQLLSRHELQLQMADAIAQLPDDYQEVIVLRNVECLPFDQVAQRLGRSRPAAQMLWMRAIGALRESATFQSAIGNRGLAT